MPYAPLISIFLVGLLGGIHCAGMCGGIAGALALQAERGDQRWRFVLAYNLGRILTYTLAGALAGGAGALLLRIPGLNSVQMVLFAVTQALLLALGLYLVGVSQVTRALETVGQRLWLLIQPLTLHCFPVRTTRQALALGSLWGFIPCGMVYSALIMAAASGTAASGAVTLLSFGLGTLPTLVSMGLGFADLQRRFRLSVIRVGAGLAVAGFGLWGFIRLATGQVVMTPGTLCITGF